MGLFGFLRKKKEKPEDLLQYVHNNRGLHWESISEFAKILSLTDGAIVHHTEEMEEAFPLKHHLKDGLYTREIFMPKGSLVVSYIHRQNHPSFFMSGEMSIVDDSGEVSRIKAPMVIQTDVGTQRVAYMHEDCVWTCVYRTDKKSVLAAEKDVYTTDYRDLPSALIDKKKELCQV